MNRKRRRKRLKQMQPLLLLLVVMAVGRVAGEGSGGHEGEKRGEGQASGGRRLPLTTREEFGELFKQKRMSQLQAVKALLSMGKYEKQHKMVTTVFGKLFEVQEQARAVVENSAYIPGGGGAGGGEDVNLPDQATALESLSSIIENCALLGDIVLRLPEISSKVLHENHNWLVNTKWCLSFTNATGLVDSMTSRMLNLVAQELNLIPRDPKFYNPYRKSPDPFADIPSASHPSPDRSSSHGSRKTRKDSAHVWEQKEGKKEPEKATEKWKDKEGNKRTISRGPRLSKRVDL